MSRLEELIGELCPNGVEYFELQELFYIKNGYTPSKANTDYWTNGTIPWFRMDDIRQNGNLLSESMQQITPQAVKGSLFPANSIIIATSATIGEHALITVESLANQRFTYLTRKDKYINLINPMFIYYYCYILDTWCKSNLNMSSFASVDMSKFVKFKFPLPPLPIQSEIVRILDNFTELTKKLTAELKLELKARRKQYEYYRNKLLTFDDNTKWQTLSEIFHIKNGYTPSKAKSEYWKGGTIPWFRMKDIRINGRILLDSIQYITPQAVKNGKLFPANSIIISTTATIGEHALIVVDSLANQQLTYLAIKNDYKNILNYKFIFYYCFVLDKWCLNNTNNSSMPSVDMTKFKKFKFPLPSLEEQQRIVSILDRFDSLCNDLTSGLPAEIEARRKQYEYYRDKLLTFKELGT